MFLTRHSKTRMKERLGATKKSLERIASKALSNGIKHSDTTGSLNKYMTWLSLNSYCGKIRIYREKVFLFNNDERLITVLPLPKEYLPMVNKIIRRKRNEVEKHERSN